MKHALARALFAAVAALAPAGAREALLGDLFELAAAPRGHGAALCEALRSLPSLLAWRARQCGAEPLVLGLVAGLACAALAAGAVDALWHTVLSHVPRRAGHAMPGLWIGVDVTFTMCAGVLGAGYGAQMGRLWRGGRTR